MKTHSLLALAITGLATIPVQAAGYMSDFTGLTLGSPLNGVDGWQQSSPNDGVDYPWAFGAEVDGSPAGAIGGFYNTTPPAGAGGFHAYHALSFSTGMSFTIQFAMIDSVPFDDGTGTLYGAERNRFSIGFYNSSGLELLSLMFDPNVDTENPDPVANGFDSWNVSTSSNGIQTGPTMAVYENSVYSLNLVMRPVAGNMNFNYSLLGTNTQSAGGVLTGLGDETITEMRMGITATDAGNGNGNQLGTNYLAFTGTAVTVPAAVPEPSSLMFFSCTLGGLALRRRRASPAAV